MKKNPENILKGINKMISATRTSLHPELTYPYISLHASGGGTPQLYKEIGDDNWKTIELRKDTLSIYLDTKEVWYTVAQRLLDGGKAEVWIDRVFGGQIFADLGWHPTLVIVPKQK